MYLKLKFKTVFYVKMLVCKEKCITFVAHN